MAYLIIFVLIFAVLVGGVVLLWSFALRRPKSDLPVCGACRYAVRGASSFECPECGADLREVGIQTPGRAGDIHPLLFLFVWTVLYGVIGTILAGIAIGIGPTVQSGDQLQSIQPVSSNSLYSIDLSWQWQMPGNAHSGSSVSSGTQTAGGQWGSTFRYGHMQPATEISDVRLKAFGRTVPAFERSLWIESDGSSYRYTNAAGKLVQATGSLDADAVNQWFADAGIQADPATLDAEAEDIAALVNGVVNKQPKIVLKKMRPGSGSSGSHVGPATWWLILVVSVLLSIWIASILLYLRQRKHKHKHKQSSRNKKGEQNAANTFN